MDEILQRLRGHVLNHRPGPNGETAIANLRFAVFDHRTTPALILCDPLICVVLQGVKQVMIGGRILRFEPGRCFISTINLPAMSAVLEADDRSPYLAIALMLDQEMLAALVADFAPVSGMGRHEGFGLEPAHADLLEALCSLVALLDRPEDIAALAPGREREVLYRLLQSGHGEMLRRATGEGESFAKIRRAVECLRKTPEKSHRIEELAEIARMSVPSFHRHFKSITSLSPLQYQKTLRLQAARRLLFSSSDVTRAAFAVGYESLSQFSREYSRLFGLSPSRDAARLKAAQRLTEEDVI